VINGAVGFLNACMSPPDDQRGKDRDAMVVAYEVGTHTAEGAGRLMGIAETGSL